MAAPHPLPTYVYKILDGPPEEPLAAELPLSELDRNDGFKHLSTAAQVPKTASLFFSSHPKLWVLKIPLDRLDVVRWEGSDDAGVAFPHLYGRLGGAEVEGVRALERPVGGWGGMEDGWVE